jgi:hypothetical protein
MLINRQSREPLQVLLGRVDIGERADPQLPRVYLASHIRRSDELNRNHLPPAARTFESERSIGQQALATVRCVTSTPRRTLIVSGA